MFVLYLLQAFWSKDNGLTNSQEQTLVVAVLLDVNHSDAGLQEDVQAIIEFQVKDSITMFSSHIEQWDTQIVKYINSLILKAYESFEVHIYFYINNRKQ